MRDRSLMAHLLLTLLAISLALTAWRRPGGHAGTARVAIAASPASLTRIDWREGPLSVQLLRPEPTANLEVRVSRSGPEAPPPQRSAGSAAAAALFTQLAPLYALRDLGPGQDPNQLAAFGLTTPRGRLELHLGEAVYGLDIGGSSFGVEDLYARGDEGHLYLLSAALLAPLRFGALSLQDRALVGLAANSFDHVRVHQGGQTRTWAYRRGDTAERAFLSDTAEPDRRLPRASAWLQRLLELRAATSELGTGSEAPSLTVTFLHQGRSLGSLRLWPDDAPESLGPLARDVRLGQPMRLVRQAVRDLLTELPTVFEEGLPTAP